MVENTMDDTAERIANEFIRRYEAAWTNGAEAVAELYATDSVLVGYVTATGRADILELVRGIIAQGWTGIKIKVVNARRVGGVVLVAAEYTALGSGANAGKTLNATSSYALVRSDGAWLASLHTAR
jgi:uncharacterized protein (TIGR02246 family)